MPRPLLERLQELQDALTHDRWRHFAIDVGEAIVELRRRENLLRTVDVNLGPDRDSLPPHAGPEVRPRP